MKPKIDLTNPIVNYINSYLTNQSDIALNADQSVERGVIPIYALLKRKAHQKPSTKAQQIGSGVLVRIKNEFFIFTATHVMFEFDNFNLMTGYGQGSQIEAYTGERFSTGNISTPNTSPLDASVFHIQQELSEGLKDLAISVDDFDLQESNTSASIFMAVGFRTRKSNVEGNAVHSKKEAFPSVELSQDYYEVLKKSSETQFLMAFSDQVLDVHGWTTSPLIKGFSGGAIIRAVGTNANIKLPNSTDTPARQLLTAIVTEHHRGKNRLPGFVVGTRINVFLGLIDKFLPGHLDDILN